MIDNSQVALAAIALSGAIIAGFFKLLGEQNKVHGKIATGLQDLAEATHKGNKEAAERNGHLADISVQQADKIVKLIKEVHK